MAPQNRPLTVLIVEDEWLIRAGAASVFEEDGWVVLGVDSGEEALGLLKYPTAVNLVFTDIQLAGAIDGWQVGRACEACDLPVVYTSGKAGSRVEAGLFFPKPYDPVAVAEACRHLLRQ